MPWKGLSNWARCGGFIRFYKTKESQLGASDTLQDNKTVLKYDYKSIRVIMRKSKKNEKHKNYKNARKPLIKPSYKR